MKKIQELADFSKTTINELQKTVETFNQKGLAILDETTFLKTPIEFFRGGPKSSLASEYVSMGRKLYKAISKCFKDLFEAAPRILNEAFAQSLKKIESENDIDITGSLLEKKSIEIPINIVSATTEYSSDEEGTIFINYFEESF